MTIAEHTDALHKAQRKVEHIIGEIRRLDASLENWKRCVETHEAAIAHAETEALRQRVRELELRLGKGGREVNLEED